MCIRDRLRINYDWKEQKHYIQDNCPIKNDGAFVQIGYVQGTKQNPTREQEEFMITSNYNIIQFKTCALLLENSIDDFGNHLVNLYEIKEQSQPSNKTKYISFSQGMENYNFENIFSQSLLAEQIIDILPNVPKNIDNADKFIKLVKYSKLQPDESLRLRLSLGKIYMTFVQPDLQAKYFNTYQKFYQISIMVIIYNYFFFLLILIFHKFFNQFNIQI
eukprot:TRINITY_DN2011_c0_g1_i3.p1 TRINITY_DN2011_c0_g1~~TRINITY_DN2011_c0_g1_i3.p1  ORF type:complete len:218 (-),score=35.54 TRINITY_DN2011_c0_g1_i3:376-1029(-)